MPGKWSFIWMKHPTKQTMRTCEKLAQGLLLGKGGIEVVLLFQQQWHSVAMRSGCCSKLNLVEI